MFQYPNYSTINQRINSAIAQACGNQPLPGSVLNAVSKAIAKELSYQYGYLDYISLQGVPFTATGTILENWGSLKGVVRDSAVAASGSITFSGTADTDIPAGSVITRNSDGLTFTTTASGVVGSPVPIVASQTGVIGNTASGSGFTLSVAISGVSPSLTLTSNITSGTDIETDDALRSRILAAFSTIPSGGTPTDHVNWLLEVPGVEQAWCAPVPVQGNVVVCYIMMSPTNGNNGFPNGTDGVSSSDPRLPAATGDQLIAANATFSLRPIGETMYISAPVPYPINITISGISNASAAQKSSISAALSNYLYSSGDPLGTSIYTTSLANVVEAAYGSSSFTLLSPADTVAIAQGGWPTLGTITYS
ncbi:Baseplate J family protein [Gluconacetobacter diazotrophicus PA1 5]|uniref:baseplate J/gp47 family protein n=1 Tax=Gluconacetobacter diazotrophicus TaxID=33996 RepID=UPI000173B3F7|nr:baseplate J/gp47 family protein [Gluconacetobacter diazotrophicus]ACI50357.1 Baseplate J family protein [Gluconacetobacter diazotrophicus PA1 5]